MTIVKQLNITAFAFGVLVMPAWGMSCDSQKMHLTQTLNKLNALQQIVLQKAQSTERAGENWENATAIAALSPDHSKQADLAKATYDQSKLEFHALQDSLLKESDAFNSQSTVFNKNCTKTRKQ